MLSLMINCLIHLHYTCAKAKQGGATGWRSYIPGASSQAGIEQVKAQVRVMEAMEEHCKDEMRGLKVSNLFNWISFVCTG